MGSVFNIFTKVMKSKTLIINWGTFVATTLTLWMNSEALINHPEIAAALAPVLAGVNVVLRWLTTDSLEDK